MIFMMMAMMMMAATMVYHDANNDSAIARSAGGDDDAELHEVAGGMSDDGGDAGGGQNGLHAGYLSFSRVAASHASWITSIKDAHHAYGKRYRSDTISRLDRLQKPKGHRVTPSGISTRSCSSTTKPTFYPSGQQTMLLPLSQVLLVMKTPRLNDGTRWRCRGWYPWWWRVSTPPSLC